jgi:hypothetical protein
MAKIVASLPEITCSMKFEANNQDTYVAKIFAGKKHFIGTFCIQNPHPAHIAITSHGRDQVFLIEGSQYEITCTVSRKGLPKLVAKYTEEPVNSLFVNYVVPASNPQLRWAKIQRDPVLCQAGLITDPVKNLTAQFFGALPLGSKINLVDPSNEVVKTIIIKPGGYNEEIGCAPSGNTITQSNLTNLYRLMHCSPIPMLSTKEELELL